MKLRHWSRLMMPPGQDREGCGGGPCARMLGITVQGQKSDLGSDLDGSSQNPDLAQLPTVAVDESGLGGK